MKFINSLSLISLISSITSTDFKLPTPPISISGNRFVIPSNTNPFFFKGIVIQDFFNQDIDPLANINLDICKGAIQILKTIGANAALVYRIDHSQRHGDCMQLFNENNIKVLVGLSPRYETRNTTYSPQLMSNIIETIDEFIHYPNTLGYLAWVENTHSFFHDSYHKMQFVIKKSLIRDIRSYIKGRYNPAQLPLLGAQVTYPRDTNIDLATRYFLCGSKESQPDFIALGSFNACEGFSVNDIEAILPKDSSVPFLFSELGCKETKSSIKIWDQISSHKDIKNVYSGGFAYQLFGSNDLSGFGAIKNNPSTTPDLDELANVWKKLNTELTIDNSERSTPSCPSDFTNDISPNEPDTLLKSPNWSVCQCAILNSPCIPSNDDSSSLSKQFTPMCTDNLPRCHELFHPINGNFSQCELSTRISLLSSYINKDATSCPNGMKTNPNFLKNSKPDTLDKCKDLWSSETPILAHNPEDFGGQWPGNNLTNGAYGLIGGWMKPFIIVCALMMFV